MDCLRFSSYALCVAAILVAGDAFQEDCGSWLRSLPNTSPLEVSEAIAHSLNVSLCVKMLLLPVSTQSSTEHDPAQFEDFISKIDVFIKSVKPESDKEAVDAEDRTDSECEGLEGVNGTTNPSAGSTEEVKVMENLLTTSSLFASV